MERGFSIFFVSELAKIVKKNSFANELAKLLGLGLFQDLFFYIFKVV